MTNKSGTASNETFEELLLRSTDLVFAGNKPELVAEGQRIVRHIFRETSESKVTVHTYIGVAMMFSSFVAVRLVFGTPGAHLYCDEFLKKLQAWTSTIAAADNTSDDATILHRS